jgi:hypothetical protein
LFLAAASEAQEAKPGPEHERLGFWVGDWKIEAEAKSNPLFPEGSYYATMTGEWFEGGFQVLCRYDWTGAMGPYPELNVMGYDQLTQQYFSYGIDGLGVGRVGEAYPLAERLARVDPLRRSHLCGTG